MSAELTIDENVVDTTENLGEPSKPTYNQLLMCSSLVFITNVVSTNAVTDTNAVLGDTNGVATNSISGPANPFATPTPVPVAAPRDLPYGTPVPGKPGFVTSPHSPNAGYVDVRGFPPGSEVKDPYSGKIFLVP
jgi:hypothetical protein